MISPLELERASSASRTRTTASPLLLVRTRAQYPADYAITQYNRGQAFLLQSNSDPQACFVNAVACFQEAHDCFLLSGHAVSAKSARQQVQRVRRMAASNNHH